MMLIYCSKGNLLTLPLCNEAHTNSALRIHFTADNFNASVVTSSRRVVHDQCTMLHGRSGYHPRLYGFAERFDFINGRYRFQLQVTCGQMMLLFFRSKLTLIYADTFVFSHLKSTNTIPGCRQPSVNVRVAETFERLSAFMVIYVND